MRLLTVAWLATVWVLLWGSFGLGDVVNGVLVAMLVIVVLPLPPVPRTGRVRPLGLSLFLLRFSRDVVVSSLQVAWAAVRPGPRPLSSVVQVALTTRSEFVMTVLSQSVSLVPGSIVVELDTEQGLLYAHVLGADTDERVSSFRESVLSLERLVQDSIRETTS